MVAASTCTGSASFVQPDGDGLLALPARPDSRRGLRRASLSSAAAPARLRGTRPRGDGAGPRRGLRAAVAALFPRWRRRSRLDVLPDGGTTARRPSTRIPPRSGSSSVRSSPSPRPVPRLTRSARCYEALGDVRDVAGFSRDAVVAYRRARPYRRGDLVGLATLMLKEAGLHQRLGSFVTSLRLLSHARGRAGAIRPRRTPTLTRSRLATRYAFGKYLQGEYGAALRWSEIGVREARASGDRTLWRTPTTPGTWPASRPASPRKRRTASSRSRSTSGSAICACRRTASTTLRSVRCRRARWDRSAAQLDRAADLFRRVGDTANEANAQYNRADLLIRQRRFAQAEPLLATALRAAQAADDRELVALVARETGQVLARSAGSARHSPSSTPRARASANWDCGSS